MMGAGKTEVGKLLAARGPHRFADLDDLVELDAGRTVSEVFEVEGEEGFRRRERAALERLRGEPGMIVATGGGAVLDHANLASMRGSGTVVWLDARPATLSARIAGSGHRPLLSGVDPAARLLELSNQRRGAYQAAAHYRVMTDGRSVEEVADEVEELWDGS
jgi:shikimate kinase